MKRSPYFLFIAQSIIALLGFFLYSKFNQSLWRHYDLGPEELLEVSLVMVCGLSIIYQLSARTKTLFRQALLSFSILLACYLLAEVLWLPISCEGNEIAYSFPEIKALILVGLLALNLWRSGLEFLISFLSAMVAFAIIEIFPRLFI